MFGFCTCQKKAKTNDWIDRTTWWKENARIKQVMYLFNILPKTRNYTFNKYALEFLKSALMENENGGLLITDEYIGGKLYSSSNDKSLAS